MKSHTSLRFVHRYVPPRTAEPATGTTLLLLHGTGGDENTLIPLGEALLPGAALLSPRGKVSENGAPRFFRRIREGVFDLEDLAVRTDELAEFVEAAASAYGFDVGRVVAAGFSNGANIAGSLLLRRPGRVSRAILLSPMVPFEPEQTPNLRGTSVFIGAGRADHMVPVAQTDRLATLLREAGAEVTIYWDDAGHTITPGEFKAAQQWLVKPEETRNRPS
jgi:phospholipase/carboxylesterase